MTPAVLLAQPVITNQPLGQQVVAGTNVTFPVGAEGTPPLAYQWEFNGVALAGATNSTLSLTNVQLFQSGSYQVVVTNSDGATTSSVAALTVSYELDFIWARQAGGTYDYDEAWSVATDDAGNVYVAGDFSGTATFGTNTLVAAGNPGWDDMFLAKYTRDGELAWVRQAGNIYTDAAMAVAVDSDGNVLVAGLFATNVWFDSILVSNRNPSSIWWDIFLAKYDGDGNVLWARNAGGGYDYDEVRSITLHTNGDPIVTGYFIGTGYFDGRTFSGYGKQEYFAARYSRNNGNLVWASFGSSSGGTPSNAGYDFGSAIAVDGAGRCYVGGHYSGTNFDFFNGFSISTTYGTYLPFVARYSPSGSMEWALPHTNVPFIRDMTGAGANGFYICGNSFVLARVDAAGNTVWSTGAGGDAVSAGAYGVATDSRGNLLLAGGFYGTNLSFPGVTFTNSATTNQCVIASYDTSGAFRWARQFGGQGLAKKVAIDPADRAYVAGYFGGTASFGSNTLTSAGGRDIFVARLGVLPPVILDWSSSQTVFTGQSNVFSVTAAGERPLDYQWSFNGTNLPGATDSTLLVADIQLTNAGAYSVVVSNAFGVAISPAAALNVITGAPAILVQPQSQVVTGGTSHAFFVLATNSLPLAYQWRLNGTNLSGATLSSLTLANISAADRGDYTVEVTNSYGSIISEIATLTVNVPATIITQPTNQVAPAGTDVTFVVGAIGDGLVTYQWRFNSAPISGATDSLLVLTNVQLSHQGNYSVVVSNVYGKATSASASLVVNAPPTITTQPQSRTLPAGTNTSFNVVASGSPTLKYQWCFNDVPLAGRTQTALGLTNIQSIDVGPYTVVVTNAFGSITSSPAFLDVLPSPPTILTQPTNLAANVGPASGPVFTVLAIGSAPLTYRWQKNNTNFPSATNASLTITNLQFTDAGSYRVIVTNDYGGVTSVTAVLTVDAGFEWARRGGGPADDSSFATAIDSSGNVYVAGYFSGNADFGTTNFISNGGEDIFVAKYNPAGSLLWVKQFGSAGNDRATAVAAAPGGGVAVGGNYSGTLVMDTVTLTNAGGSDVFLARVDSDGNVAWAVRGGGTYSDLARGVAVSSIAQRFFLTGSFQTNAMFGSSTFNEPATSNKLFIASYDNGGNFSWAATTTGPGPSQGCGIAADPGNFVCVAGTFGGSANFGGTSLSTTGALACFVAKYSSGGNTTTWARRLGSATNTPAFNQQANGIALDTNSNSFVVGSFQGEVSFIGTNKTVSFNTNQPDAFLFKLDSNGNGQWVKQIASAGADAANGVAVDGIGNAYVTGTFSNNLAFGNTVLSNAGGRDVFVALFDAQGTPVKARRAGGGGDDAGQSVATDGRGGVFIAGQSSTTAAFGSITLTNVGARDAFVARLSFFPSNAPPQITTEPRSQTIAVGGSVKLNVGVVSGTPVTYQWRRFGTNIVDATTNSYTIANAQYSNTGDFSVRVQNSALQPPANSATSAVAVVSLELTPDFLWLRRSGNTGDDQALAVALDGTNAVYVAGLFSGTNPAFTNLVSAGSNDIFLAKYDREGNLLWAKRAGGTLNDAAQALHVDKSGNVLMAGYFFSTLAEFDGVTLTNKSVPGSGFSDLFLAKYGANGNLIWVRQGGGTTNPNILNRNDTATAIVTDAEGSTFLTGSFHSTMDLNGVLLTNVNSTNFFVAKFDAAGNVLWARTTSGMNSSQGSGICLDASTNVYVTGFLLGSLNLGNGVLTNPNPVFAFGNGAVFVAKYDNAGALQWVRTAPGVGGNSQALAADASGAIYATSYKRDYGNGVCLTKYDSSGNVIWYRTAAISCCTGDYTSVAGLALDGYGNPIVAGYGNGNIEGITNNYNGGFVLKYRSDGTGFWFQRCASMAATGTGSAAVAVDAENNAFIAGRFTGTSFFGATSNLVSAGGNDAFLARLGLRPPGMTMPRTDLLVIAGSNATLQLPGLSGTGPFAYQWQFNGTNIAGATQSLLALSNFSFANAGRYSVVMQNTVGLTTGQVAAIGFIPVLSASLADGGLRLSWDGEFMMQSATNVAGPYADLAPATSPFTNPFAPDEPLRFFRLRVGNPTVSGTMLANQWFSVGLTGSPGRIYAIQASTNLVDWMPLQTDASPFTLQDSNAVMLPQRYYRAVLSP